jgi:aminodeoxyfutalosine deaminase
LTHDGLDAKLVRPRPSIGDHPARRFYELGMLLSINSDDPQMFGNSLAEEYRMLKAHHGFSHAEIRELILQGIESSWLPAARKERLAQEFVADPDGQN